MINNKIAEWTYLNMATGDVLYALVTAILIVIAVALIAAIIRDVRR